MSSIQLSVSLMYLVVGQTTQTLDPIFSRSCRSQIVPMKHSYADLQAAALRVLPEIITIRQSDHSRIAETNEPGAVLALPTA